MSNAKSKKRRRLDTSTRKLYAVGWKSGEAFRDGFPCVFDNWDDCRPVVDGAKGLKYKKFSTLDDCATYLGVPLPRLQAHLDGDASPPPPAKATSDKYAQGWTGEAFSGGAISKEGIDIYTDGGCDNNGTKDAAGGFGVVILRGGKTIHEMGLPMPFEFGVLPTNIRAELHGVKAALTWMLMSDTVKSAANVTLHVDLKHIMAVLGTPIVISDSSKKNTQLENEVRQLLQWLKTVMHSASVSVVHVKGHSGDPHNERADMLATIGKKRYGRFLVAREIGEAMGDFAADAEAEEGTLA